MTIVLNKHTEVTFLRVYFWGKLLCPTRDELGIVGLPVFVGRSIFLNFWNSANYIFSKLYLMKKAGKSGVLDFQEKVLLCSKWGKWRILGTKINTFWVFSKSVYWVFLKLYLRKGINNWLKVTVLNFKWKLILCSK